MNETNSSPSLPMTLGSSGQLPQCKVPKVIFHFVRHGQATHNIKSLSHRASMRILDPPLTPLGSVQAAHLAINFEPLSRLTHALVSPSRRTLETLLDGFRSTLISKNIEAIAYPSLRELFSAPCNRGHDLADLKLSMRDEPVDMRLVHEGWDHDENGSEESRNPMQRVKDVKWDLLVLKKILVEGGTWKGFEFPKWERDCDIEILIVSHRGFLKELLDIKPLPGSKYPDMYHLIWD